MYSVCALVIFSLGLMTITSGSDSGEPSDGAECSCDKSFFHSTLTCTLQQPNDFVNVKADYCGKPISGIELLLHRNSYISSSMLPKIPVFRMHIIGEHLKDLSADTFVGHEDRLRFVEISRGALTDVPTEALQHVPHLESLILAENAIHLINCSLQERSLNALILRDNQISLVYSCAFPQSLTSLGLQNNRIENLNGSLKHHKNLKWLFIERNKITSLEGELEGMDSLSILNAGWNKITTIGTEGINLPELSSLDLSHNRISKLEGSLTGFTNLISLDLSDNDLEDMWETPFKSLRNLRTLSLSANNIRYLNLDAFYGLQMLERLTISNNLIQNLQGRLNNVNFLRKLDASWNKVKFIGSTFTFLPKLEELELSHNQIDDLEGCLSELSELKSLDLSFNDLTEVNERHFAGVKNLQKLNLLLNHIKPLKGKVFASLTKLATLDLSYNQFQTLKDLVVDGFMNITLPKDGAAVVESGKCSCKHRKSLVVIGNLHCNSETQMMMEVLRENGIELVGC